MKTSAAGIEFIKDWEALCLNAYDDEDDQIVKLGESVLGTLTIGYGHTSAAGPPKVYAGMEITEAEADQILLDDLRPIEEEVARLVKVPLRQNQFDALVSFQFNTGWLEHPHCSLLAAVNAGNFPLAEEDFMLYNRASGRILKGLTRRRKAEMRLFHGQS